MSSDALALSFNVLRLDRFNLTCRTAVPTRVLGTFTTRTELMSITFPNESPEHRAARNRLLEREMGLRRLTEAVAAERRALPPGGVVPEHYAFTESGCEGSVRAVTRSGLFAPGRASLVVFNMMFPRYAKDDRPGP